MNILNSAPEVAKCVTTAIGASYLSHLSQSGVTSKPENLSVVTNIDFTVVKPSLEKECISLVAPLAVVTGATHFTEDAISDRLASTTGINDLDCIGVPNRRIVFSSCHCYEKFVHAMLFCN
jgi:hypothetical protein